MWLKAKNIYYKLNDSLSLRMDSFFASLEPVQGYPHVILDDIESYKANIGNSLVFVAENQAHGIVKDVIQGIFKDNACDIETRFLPPNTLIINFCITNYLPVTIEGKVTVDKASNDIIFSFNRVDLYRFAVRTIFDAINKIPGLNISYETKDKKARLELQAIRIFTAPFITDIKANYNISDISFNETGVCLEIEGDSKVLAEINPQQELPDSYAYFYNANLKVNKLELNNANIALYREDGTPFTFSFTKYRELVDKSVANLNKFDEIILKIIETQTVQE